MISMFVMFAEFKRANYLQQTVFQNMAIISVNKPSHRISL